MWASSSTDALINSFHNSLSPIQAKNSPYALVRELLAYRTPEATKYGEYTDLKSLLEADVTKALKAGDVSRVSFYFRDLDTARWVGIDQDVRSHPASLMKVPLMIAYYKVAEIDPALFSKRVTYHTVTDLPAFDTPSELVEGKIYTIAELMRRMIIDSDNGATYTLLEQINPELLSGIYTALGIPEPGVDTAEYQISARTYGLFFRILYNATYLSPASSEKALDLLTRTTFANALVGGVPEGVKVAHKWGEHVEATKEGIVTGIDLSDCGVVYYPEHPYLLCVMVSAKNETTAEDVIKTISKTTYDGVVANYK
jgi:beta-lactamase class A